MDDHKAVEDDPFAQVEPVPSNRLPPVAPRNKRNSRNASVTSDGYRRPPTGDVSMASYNRSYSLTLAEHDSPPPDTVVERFIPTARQPSFVAGGVPDPANTSAASGPPPASPKPEPSPMERFPRIELKRKEDKYDRLARGGSSAPPGLSSAARAAAARREAAIAEHRNSQLQAAEEEQRIAGGNGATRAVSNNGGTSSSSPYHGSRDLVPLDSGVNGALTYSRKEIDVDLDAAKDELTRYLDRLDFLRARQEARVYDLSGENYAAAKRYFTLISKRKGTLMPEEMHELLLLYTTPGVALHEALDFFREECDGRSYLSFNDFLQYGDVFRDRIHDYENFEPLSKAQKLRLTCARVYPGKPPEDLDELRLLVLKASQQQWSMTAAASSGAAAATSGGGGHARRSLRVYEHVFITDLQHTLYREGHVDYGDVPNDVCGDLSSDRNQPKAPQVRRYRPPHERVQTASGDAPGERIGWGDGEAASSPRSLNTTAAGSPVAAGSSRGRGAAEAGGRSAKSGEGGRNDDYPMLASCNDKLERPPSKPTRSKDRRGVYPGKTRPCRQNTRFTRSRSRGTPKDRQKGKYLGRSIDDQQRAREEQDDYLVGKLATNYYGPY